MKRRVASVAFLAMLSASAFAADLPSKPVYKAAPLAERAFNWTGFYFGGHLGYLWATTQNDAALPNASGRSWFGGIQGGYRYQFANNVVLGIQISAPLFAQNQSVTIVGTTLTDTLKFKGSVMAQGQLGYAMGRWLPFITAGIGAARVEAQETSPTTASLVVTNTHTLYTAGIGVRYAITQNWITGLAYNHLWTSKENYNCGPALCATVGNFSLTGDSVAAVLEYRF